MRPDNVRPVIIKRKIVRPAEGHHGGAWKVAYADFVTAMMAFFLMLWLLGAVNSDKRQGLADYFSPTISIQRDSTGMSGALTGESIVSSPQENDKTAGVNNTDAETALLQEIEAALAAMAGESDALRTAMRHVITRQTDRGLIVEIFDLPDAPLFDPDSQAPMPVLVLLASVLAEAFGTVTNPVAIEAHSRSLPVVLRDNPVWDVTVLRAQAKRVLLSEELADPGRIMRVTGHADRTAAVLDPMAERNNRLEVILLRTEQSLVR